MGTNGDQSFGGAKPEAPFVSFPTGRFGHAVTIHADHPILLSVGRALQPRYLSRIEIGEVLLSHAEDSFAAAHPKESKIILEDFIHIITEETVMGGVGAELRIASF